MIKRDRLITSFLGKMLGLALVTYLYQPFTAQTLPLSLSLSGGVIILAILGLSRSAWRIDHFLVFLPCAVVVVAQTVTLGGVFPERSLSYYFYGFLFLVISSYTAFKCRPQIPSLLLVVGLSSCPFTELHLKRSPWIILLGVFILIDELLINRERLKIKRQQLPVLGSGLFFITCILVSSLLSLYPHGSLQDFSGYLVHLLFFGYVVIKGDAPDVRNWLVFLLLVLGGTFAGFGLLEMVRRVYYLDFTEAISFRVFVFARHPNYVTYYSSLMLPLMAWFSLQAKRRLRLLGIAATIIMVAYLIITYSRTAWLMVVLYLIGGLALAVKRVTPKRLLLIVLPGILILTVFIGFFEQIPKSFQDRILSIRELERTQRGMAWTATLRIAKDHLFLGSGLSTKRYLMPLQRLDYPYQPITRQYLADAHSTYFELLSSCGVLGLVSFLIFLGCVLLPLLKQSSRYSKALCLTAGGMLFDFLFHYRFPGHDTSILAWTCLALFALHRAEPKSTSTPNLVLPINRAAAYVLGIVSGLILMFAALPSYANLTVDQGRRLLTADDWDGALAKFRLAQVLEPLNAHNQYLLALWYQMRGLVPQALAHFTRATELNPHYAFYHDFLGSSLLLVDDYAKAEKRFAQAFSLDPYNPNSDWAFNLGKVRYRLERREEAFTAFVVALGMRPTLARDAFWQHEDTSRLLDLVLQEHVRESRELLNQPEGWNEAAVRLLNTATAYQLLGNVPKAEACLQYLLAKRPDFADAVLQLAELYLNQGNHEAAEQAIRAVFQYDARYALYHNLLGVILTDVGRVAEAIEEFQKSLKYWTSISMDNYVAHYYLAQLYELNGQAELAAAEQRKTAFIARTIDQEKADLQIHTGKINEIKELERVRKGEKP